MSWWRPLSSTLRSGSEATVGDPYYCAICDVWIDEGEDHETTSEEKSMKTYDLRNEPGNTIEMRKTATIRVVFIEQPFRVDTQEGLMTISPADTDDWEDGYYLVYPSDGSKPYSISPSFMRDNYTEVV